MKKTVILLAGVLMLGTISFQSHAQAWGKGTNVIGIHLGASNMFHVNRGTVYSPITGELLVQGEFSVHEYVGVGFSAGFGGRAGGSRGVLYWGWGYNPEINVPVGVLANFHFYQLIADKTGKNLHADKLDIYAGVSLGSGVAFVNPGSGQSIWALAYGGPHAGIRYYFTEKLGVTAEVGYGKTFVNGGLVFKL